MVTRVPFLFLFYPEVTVEFSQSSYTVVEGEGVVSVTVVLMGSRERVVVVEVSTTDTNATGNYI